MNKSNKYICIAKYLMAYFVHYILPILNVIFLIVLPITISSARAYFKSFISESAKSNVQKRDIEELTQKVESVKAIYSKENELIKYQLSQLLALKGQHRNEERNALMKFHASYIHWIYLLYDVRVNDYSRLNLNELLEKKLSLNNYFYDIHVTRANVLLIVNNAEIIDLTYKLIKELSAYKYFIENNLLTLQFLLTDSQSILETFLELRHNEQIERILMDEKVKEDTENRAKIKTQQEEFNKSRVSEFQKCKFLCDEFAEKCKEYLLSID